VTFKLSNACSAVACRLGRPVARKSSQGFIAERPPEIAHGPVAGAVATEERTDGSLEGVFVEEEGLLTKSDIKRIEREALLAREQWISSLVEGREVRSP